MVLPLRVGVVALSCLRHSERCFLMASLETHSARGPYWIRICRARLDVILFLVQVNIFLSYVGGSYMELEDVDNVHLKLHPLVYTNKTWTPRKLLLRIRRDVILDVLSQVSRAREADRSPPPCTR